MEEPNLISEMNEAKEKALKYQGALNAAMHLACNTKLEYNQPKRRGKFLGEKSGVHAYWGFFNGTPQIRVFYGKTFYSFNIVPAEVSEQDILNSIKGRHGVEALTTAVPSLCGFIDVDKLRRRQYELEREGV